MARIRIKEEDKRIGQILTKQRKERGLSLREVGDILGVTFQQIQKYEKGTNRIAISTLIILCKGLDSSTDEYFNDSTIEITEPEENKPLKKLMKIVNKMSQDKISELNKVAKILKES